MRGTLQKAARCAAFSVSIALASVGAAPSATGIAPGPLKTGSLAGGGTYVISHSDAAPVAAISLWYRAPSSGFAPTATPGIGRLAAAAVAASAPITGTPLSRLVDRVGGRISVSSYPDSVAISTIVPADRAAEIVRAITVSYFAPVLTDDGLKVARRDIAEDAFFRSFNPDETIDDQLAGALFSDGPAHQPAVANPSAIERIPMSAVESFAKRAFRSANAVLVVTGAVDASVIATAVPGRPDPAPSAEPFLASTPVLHPAPIATSSAEAGAGIAWTGPPIENEREATAMDFIVDYLFRADYGKAQSAIALSKSTLVGKYVTYHNPGVVFISISGGDAIAAREIVLRSLATAQIPLEPAAFAAARSAFAYHIASDVQTPGELADTLGWYTVEGDPGYAPGSNGRAGKYFAAVDALTPEFVAATVKKYINGPSVSLDISAKAPDKTAKPSAGRIQ